MLAFDKLFENKTLMFSAGAVAFLVAALLILLIIRLAFGRRLHMPGGGRARQPRLGIVDAFDLDRQRQLVLVRRDNIEHLIMIGGPNDVLIESQIIRAEAREVRPRENAREKEGTVSPLTWPAGAPPAGLAAPAAASAPEPKLTPEELPVAVLNEAAPPAPAYVPPAAPPASIGTAPLSPPAAPPAAPPKRPPFLPLPPRRPIGPPFGAKPPISPAGGRAADAVTDQGSNSTTIVAPVPPITRTPAAPPSFLRPRPAASNASAPPQVPSGAAPLPAAAPPRVELAPRAEVPASAASEIAVPEIVPPQVSAPQASTGEASAPMVPAPDILAPEAPSTAKSPSQMDALESLEEEMAKLLGRNTKDS